MTSRTSMLTAVPVKLREANSFVDNFHRHNKPVQGARFAIGAEWDSLLVGVAIVGRAIQYKLDGNRTAEVLRLCTDGMTRQTVDRRGNAHTVPICSFLYQRCWQAWRAMGGTRLITYTLASEPGISLRAAGWRIVAEVPPPSGRGWTNRPGREWQPIHGQLKLRWEARGAERA